MAVAGFCQMARVFFYIQVMSITVFIGPRPGWTAQVTDFGSLCLSARANGPNNMGHSQVQYFRSGDEGIGPSTLILLESPQGVTTGSRAVTRFSKYVFYSQEATFSSLCVHLNQVQYKRMNDFIDGKIELSTKKVEDLTKGFSIRSNNCTNTSVGVFNGMVGTRINAEFLGMAFPAKVYDLIAFHSEAIELPREAKPKIFTKRREFFKYICNTIGSSADCNVLAEKWAKAPSL
jgi:hypothetical protein